MEVAGWQPRRFPETGVPLQVVELPGSRLPPLSVPIPKGPSSTREPAFVTGALDIAPESVCFSPNEALWRIASRVQIARRLHVSRGDGAVRMNRAIALLKRRIDARTQSLWRFCAVRRVGSGRGKRSLGRYLLIIHYYIPKTHYNYTCK